MKEITQIKFEKYPKYKPSGEKWIEKIPDGWRLEKLGSILKPVSIKNHPDEQLLSITREKGVIVRDVENDDGNHNFIPDDLSGYKLLENGQFGMNKMKAWQGSYGVSHFTGIISPAYYVFKFADDINPNFFHVAIRSKRYVSFFGQASDGVRIGQWDLSKDRMKKIPFAIPPKVEQTAIANFLDKKNAKIDLAIAQKERLIELLQERKQIIIQQAVTKGLDPEVEMKDSGVEWIGEVPVGWEVVSNRILFNERKDPGRDELPLLSVSIHSAVSTEELNDDDNIRGKIKIEDKSSYKYVNVDDIVFNMMRAWQGAIGAVRVEGMVSPAYVVATPKNDLLVSSFFEHQYRTDSFIQQMSRNSKGITDFRKRLYWNEFKQLQTILPSVDEQLAIVQYIESISLKTEKTIQVQEQQIAKLKEYKATLIDSAVTGKIKVG